MRPTSSETQASIRPSIGRVGKEKLWLTVAAVTILSSVHIAWVWNRVDELSRPGWPALLALVVFPPVWGGTAFLRSTRSPIPQPLQIAALAWGIAVAGLHILFHGHRDSLLLSAISHPLVAWCLLWTGFFYIHFQAQPYLRANGISPRQLWKLSGASLATVGVVFWGWPLRDWPLAGPGLLYFAGAIVLFGSGASLSACAYLERLGAGISNWPLRRFLGTLFQTFGVIAMLASMVSAVAYAGETVFREALAAGISTSAGAACLLYTAVNEWRYYRGSTRPEV